MSALSSDREALRFGYDNFGRLNDAEHDLQAAAEPAVRRQHQAAGTARTQVIDNVRTVRGEPTRIVDVEEFIDTADRAFKLDGRSIVARIEADYAEVRSKWAAFREGGAGSTIPPTMIEILDADVTAKARSIALSAKFGPTYKGGIRFVENQLAKEGDDLRAFRATVARIMSAKDPDHLASGKPS